ncbi:cytochrome c-type biogenesis protein [Bacillus sp. 1NLA3E]|uniref:cytochrome c-type biogenesis protein n=1 Tax=Bacillus sp. 1NLA3E TaxID=666686 RepID=UPI000247E515|nr:cytochrome c-type biogenesis protein [Bacillus sp. 1NLA3E]AGK54857.1 hypothetical protein B1NLA3E_15555 [Bacillus sp. 1NLA3E]
MNRKLSIGLLIFLFIFQGALAVFAAGNKNYDYKSKEFKAVGSQFMCTCGCGQDIYNCDMPGCSVSKTFKEEIVGMMNKGMDKDQIKNYYVNAIGEEILTAPEQKGFSLVAWILPFAVMGGAGTGVFFVIRKWVKKKGTNEQGQEETQSHDEVEEEILSSMIDSERKKYL